ncbi:hypothetical protein [Methylobacterium sp.]|uniref:hypothetical protein n=1 Tax=Methylobacterium sp. TaxID=409 RepID=UPI003B016283
MPHPLLTGLADLPAADLHARLVEARKTATALVTTDLDRGRHDALVAGVSAVDAALRQASLDGVTALVRHIEAATPAADHPALKRRPAPPMIDPRAMITPTRRAPIPPRVPVPAPVPAAPRPPGGLGALRRGVPAPQPEEEPETARPRPREIGTPERLRRIAGRTARPSVHPDGTVDWRIPASDPSDDDIPW